MASRSTPSSRPAQPLATLVPQGTHAGKPSMPLNRLLTLVGSRHRAHLHLLSRTISKTHAALVSTLEGVYIRDLASRTHVLVNGKAVKEVMLNAGDTVTLGSFTFRYSAGPVRRVVGRTPPEAVLQIQGSPIPIPFDERTVLIGRRPTCDIPLTELSVSICHALIFEIDGVRYVRDLGSRTGTFVNGQTVHQQALELGDTLRIGETEIRYADAAAAAGEDANLDELEDLVGTASLADDDIALMPSEDEHEASAPVAPVSSRAPRPTEIRVTATPAVEPVDSFDFADDRAREDRPSSAPQTPASPVRTNGASQHAEADDLDLIPLADPSPAADADHGATAPTSDQAVEGPAELDLMSDPDVSGSGDTAHIAMETVISGSPVKPSRPAISDLIVEDPNTLPPDVSTAAPAGKSGAPLGDSIDLYADEHTQVMVDSNLHEQRLSGSGTFAGMDLDLREDVESHSGDVQVDVKDLSLDAWGASSEPIAADSSPSLASAPAHDVNIDFASSETAADIPPVDLTPANIVPVDLTPVDMTSEVTPPPLETRPAEIAFEAGASEALATPPATPDVPDALGTHEFLEADAPGESVTQPVEAVPEPLVDFALESDPDLHVTASIDTDDHEPRESVADPADLLDAGEPEIHAPASSETAGASVSTSAEPDIEFEDDLHTTSAGQSAPPSSSAALSDDDALDELIRLDPPSDVPTTTNETAASDVAVDDSAFADLDLSSLDFSEGADKVAPPLEAATETPEAPLPSAETPAPLLGLGRPSTGAAAGLIDLTATSLAPAASPVPEAKPEAKPKAGSDIEPPAVLETAIEGASSESEPAKPSWRKRWKGKTKKSPPAKPLRIPPAPVARDQAAAIASDSVASSQTATDEPATSDNDSAEVLTSTTPTPDSAQVLAREIGGSGLGGLVGESEAPLTDSTFGRAVQEFSGSHLDPLEESAGAPFTTSTESNSFEPSSTGSDALPLPLDAFAPPLPTSGSFGVAASAPLIDLGMIDDAPMTESGLTDLSFEIAEQVLAADAAFFTSDDGLDEMVQDLGLISEDPYTGSTVEDLEAPLELAPIETSPDASSFTDPAEELATLLGKPATPITFTPIAPTPYAAAPSSPEAPAAEPLGATDLGLEPEIELSADLSSAPNPADRDVPVTADGAVDLAAFGMTRDQASFIGGMPINWDAPQSSTRDQSTPATSTDPADFPEAADAFVPDALISEAMTDPGEDALNFAHEGGEETLASFLSRLENTEPTPELFDSAPSALDSLPDSMHPIQDVVEVLGEAARPPGAGDPPEFVAPPIRSRKPADRVALDPAPPLVAPRVVPPPPPRARGTSRGKTAAGAAAFNPFGAGSENPAALSIPEITIPPYTGTKPASQGHITTAFDGLAMPPVRETDVFSQLANPAAAGALAGLSAGADVSSVSVRHGLTGAEYAPGEPVGRRGRPPGRGGRSGNGALPPAVPPDMRTNIPDYAPAPRNGTAAPSPRFPGAQAKARFDSARPPRRRMRLGILLPVVIALAVGSAVAIQYLVHVQATAQLFLRFDGLDKVSPQQRLDLERQQHEILSSRETRQSALQIYNSSMGGKGGDGFLGTQDNAAYASLVDSATIAPGSSKLTMQMSTVNPSLDRLRLLALLQKLYSLNQKMADDAGSAKLAYEKAVEELSRITSKLTALNEEIKGESESGTKLADALRHVDELKQANAKQWKAWTDAAAKLRDAQADVDRLDVKTVADAGNTTPGGSSVKAEDDPQIKELAARLTTLTTRLNEAHSSHTASTDAANKALDTALSGFAARVAEARSSLKDGSELGGYLAAAQQAQDTIRQLNADLIERQKSEQQQLNDLRRVLADKQEARLKAAWESDPQLTQMQQDLSVAEHHFNAASGSGLGSEAKTLATQIDTLKKQIDARRDLISTGDIYADEVKGLQQFIDKSLQSMDRERARNDQRMADALKTLAAAAPKIEKLPADQQKMAEDFENRLAEMTKARQQFNAAIAASAPDADVNAKALEAESTELQAKLDTRRKQISEENRKALSIQQQTARAHDLEAAKQRLAEAKDAENIASVAVRANKEQLDDAQSAVDHERVLMARSAADTAHAVVLTNEQKQQQEKVDELHAAMEQAVVPEKPTEENITMPDLNDPRKIYMLYSSLGFALLLVVLLLAMSRGMHHHPPHLEAAAEHSEHTSTSGNGYGYELSAPLEGRGNARGHTHADADDKSAVTV